MHEASGRARPSKERVHRATVAAGFVRGVLAGCRPAERAAALRRAGVDPAELARGERIPIAQYVDLYNAVAAVLRDEGLGLFRAAIRPGAFEFLCRASLGSRDLGEALERAARFLGLVLPELAVSVRRRGGEAHLEIREATPLRRRREDPARIFAFEWLLRMLHALGCWLAARALPLAQVDFPYRRPAHHADYALIYTERSTFEAAFLDAVMDASLLDLPVRRAQEELASFLEGAPGRISMLYRRDREAARAVRELLSGRIGQPPSLEEAARMLGMSARTLHRRLRQEGTSFRLVHDTVRRDRAIALLAGSRLRISQVAGELGYSEPSAFFRAFRDWTGMGPTAYRNSVARP
ncbi:MAG TPA: AraC family transcriptional regulator ligand-binding domain-containing protein [Usitatibacter sp.]|nr:AraC family transcriptional regulator ligand-binding domain-containing protein [Usitatibacter sp.]